MTRAHGTATPRAARARRRRDGALALRLALAAGSALCLIEALTATMPSPESPAGVATSSRPTVVTVPADAGPADRDPPSAAACLPHDGRRVGLGAGG